LISGESVREALLDESNGEVGDVDADPTAVEALSHLDEWCRSRRRGREHVAFVGAGLMIRSRRASGFALG